MGELITSLGIVGTIFLLGVAVLWIVLPFAIFGIKEKLGEMIDLLETLVEHNERLHPELEEDIDEEINEFKTMTACLKCLHYLEISDSLKQCKKTNNNLLTWGKNEYLETKMNPCEGNFFIEKSA